MNKIVFVVFAFVAVLQVASALQCYDCIGSNCAKDMKTWGTTTCGNVPPPANNVYACLKLTFKDRVSHNEMVTRKCVLAEKNGDKIHLNCPTTDGDPISCPVCTKDLCNSGHSIKFSLLALSSVAVLAIVAPKFL